MTKAMMRRAITVALWMFLALGGVCRAEQGPAGNPPGEESIRITSDRLEANEASRKMEFIGNVVARQGSLTIYAQSLAVFYSDGNREIERVEARGDVRVVQGDRVATGQQGIFYRREGRIVLSGSPRVHEGEDFVEGDEITVFLDQERSIVKGGDNARVNAVFHPKGERQ